MTVTNRHELAIVPRTASIGEPNELSCLSLGLDNIKIRIS